MAGDPLVTGDVVLESFDHVVFGDSRARLAAVTDLLELIAGKALVAHLAPDRAGASARLRHCRAETTCCYAGGIRGHRVVRGRRNVNRYGLRTSACLSVVLRRRPSRGGEPRAGRRRAEGPSQ